MSDFKIIGNPNPVVGVLEFYTVSDFFSEISPTQEFVYIPNSPENQVKWEVYVLEFGKWRKTKENDKTGKQITYTFFEKSLTRQGIRLLARKGEKVARLDISPLPAHPKIDHIELLDKNGSKITGRLAYGQTVKARVFCLNMEKRRVHVTLWEDDVKGAGHSKANVKNFIETRSAIVNFGKADIDFLLRPSFAKIATKGGPENDKIHEYYVTAEYDREKTASNNVNVDAPETPIAPYKGKTKQPVKTAPAKQPKSNEPKPNVPIVPTTVKGKINSVNITDTAGRAIKGAFREKQIKVWINSSGLIGKDVRLKLFDDDYGKDDLLFHQEFAIKSDLHAIVVSLDTIPRSWGGNYLEEGNEQELFAEVEVLQTHAFTKSAIVDVDATVFKQDPFEIFNTVFKVDMPDKKERKKTECFCNKDFEEKDVRKLVKLLKGSESIWEGQALKGGKRVDCFINDKSFATLTNELNATLKKYQINSCIQKIHFLAQVCEETGTFTLSEETKSKYASSQSIYKGRGILQLTGIKNESETYYDQPGPYKSYAEYKSDQNIVKKPEIVASHIQYAIDSGGWIWSINQKMTNNPNSQAITRWGLETLGKSLNELSIYEDKYFELISVLLNGRGNDNMPIGWAARQSYYNILKTGFFFYQRYHGETENPLNAKDVITYHIYSGGKIEKHIPKEIKLENKKKYKYVYHDKNDKEHVLGIFDFFLTTEMNKGNITGKNSVELIDVREFKGYSSDGIKLKFITLNTDSKRYYINPDCYAGLLGAMADMNIDYLGFNGFSNFEAKSTGGSSSHINGEKGDLRYLSKNKKGEPTLLQDIHFDVLNQNRFNDVLYNFGWGRLEKMYSEYFTYDGDRSYLLNHTKNMRKDGPKGYRHYHHLHLSGFDHSQIKIIKE